MCVIACFWCLCARLAGVWRFCEGLPNPALLGRLNRYIARRPLLVLRIVLYRDKPQVKLDNR